MNEHEQMNINTKGRVLDFTLFFLRCILTYR